MRLKVRKLGPVKEGAVELGDITLFLGPPNTGKSYTLRAIYAKLFPLDDYALDTMEKKLSSLLIRYLEREFPEHALSRLYDLSKIMTKILMAIVFLPQKDRMYSDLVKLISVIAEKGGLQVTSEQREDFLLVNVKTPPIEMIVETRALKQAIQEAIYEFTTELIPVEDIDSIVFEPIDPSRLDIDFIAETIERETRMSTRSLLLLLGGLFDYLDYYIVRELMHRHEGFRRALTPLIARYLRYLTRYFSIKLNLKLDIQPDIDTIKLASTITLSLRLHTHILLIPKRVPSGVSLEAVEKIVDEVFEKARSDLRLNRIISRIVDAIRDAVLGAFVDSVSKNTLYSGLREVMRNRLGYGGLRFIPFGRSILVLGIEGASREPYTRPEFLRSFIREFYPNALASYVYWASKGRSLLLEGRLTEGQVKLLEAATPLLEGRLISDVAAGRLLYQDWRSSVVDFQMSSALVEEVSGLVFALLTVDENSIILIEEPEAQLHPGAQIVMALFLASLLSLCKCKVVASTHSDLLAITLSQLVVQKPDKEWVKELIERLLPHIKEGADILADTVAESAKGLDLRVYEFTREGMIKLVKPEDVLGKEVPGISRVVDELTDWAFRLASYRASREAG